MDRCETHFRTPVSNLAMIRFLCTAALLAATAAAQSTDLKFEVASIKPSGGTPGDIKIDPSRIEIPYWSIKQLITRAYGVWPYQVDGPKWINTTRFDIVATFPHGGTRAQLPEMLRSLLADRLGLITHQETRELPAYALVVGKGGPKMRVAAPEDVPAETHDTSRILDGMYGSGFGLKAFSAASGEMHMALAKMPMAALAQIVSSWLGVPVVDRTSLKDNYQATLDFSLADTVAAVQTDATAGGVATDPPGTSLFAMIKHLGLALERVKAPVSILVVDHVEQVPREE